MRQRGLSVIAPIKNGQVDALHAVLKTMQDEMSAAWKKNASLPHDACQAAASVGTTNSYILFEETTTHFARFVLIDHDPAFPPVLFFATNFDGTVDAYLEQLFDHGPGRDEIWGKCKGYRAGDGKRAFKDFIKKHSLPISTFYVCYPGITTKSAKNALEVFCRITNFLDENRAHLEGKEPGAIIDEIKKFVKGENIEVMDEAMPRRPLVSRFSGIFRTLFIILLTVLPFGVLFVVAEVVLALLRVPAPWLKALLFVGGVIVLLGVVFLVLLVILRRQEGKERVAYRRTHTSNYVPSRLVEELEAIEETIAQNQMTLVTPIKPAFIRRLALKVVLFAVNFLARFTLTQGTLGDVRTVHFARWFPIDAGERLIFNSQFDESWQQYIGAFVDLLPVYLTGIWGNTRGYPPTKNLVQDGATDIEGFMQFIRESQIPADVFYSAYSEVAAQNIVNAVRVREGLKKKLRKEKDQKAWLRRFAGTISILDQHYEGTPEVDRKDPQVKDPGNHEDIQGWIIRSYKHATHTGYLFLKVKEGEAAQARAWLGKMAAETTATINPTMPLVPLRPARQQSTYAFSLAAPDEDTGQRALATNLAFTAGGLQALGLPEDALLTFPTEFRQGIAQEYFKEEDASGAVSPRSRKLGDTGESAPQNWDVGGPEKPFDILVTLYVKVREDEGERKSNEVFDEYLEEQAQRIEAAGGLKVIYRQAAHRVKKKIDIPKRSGEGTRKKPIIIEHFGFRDGIAEPAIRHSGFNKRNQITIAAGEFILGYKNQYDFFPVSPSVQRRLDPQELLPPTRQRTGRKDLGRNGTFMVFRKLSQDVPGFWTYFQEQTTTEEEMIKLASRSVGRWPEGVPLTLTTDRDDPRFKALATDEEINDFLYVKDGDAHGFGCPYAAHIRRSNPRDSLSTTNSLTIADRHHILRRAVAYGEVATLPPWDNGQMPADDGKDRGLMFFVVNTSFRRQFEFVQMAWNNGPRFNGLYNTRDPVIGPQPPEELASPPHPEDFTGDLTLEQEPYRLRTEEIPRFTKVKGGAYLFLPSISALKFLAQLPG